MSDSKFSWPLFDQAPLVGIIRNVPTIDVIQLLPLFWESGLTTLEITMNTPGAETLIQYAREHYADSLNVGAGTVCTTDDLTRALAAGAQFIVSPIVSRPVILACVGQGIPVFPGAFTPTEIYEAWSLGASMVKVFPATSLGPGYIKDLKAPLSQVKLLPTGGVTLSNLADFFQAGANGVGVGSQLFNNVLIQDKDWTGLKNHFQEFSKQLPANKDKREHTRP
ncbi:MAG TPA: bifunctional 4-hydroxy-2-oxoglutarate aldolase/2-dehydro-3-deoxy-phosphogluconate aldolase [Spirosoma sp.]|jgi:2-dehydro-3-deoxyphosphogluconate aldolase/(4S)-4-hydroxy-2-oxoglutarate aldolase|nr:bifunctional 4-hydroxy-2-oxoglutarate aldolase/2-dehydro-3-deoxy-phosphogluconate aldolase [Spirosoma sp.]